MSRRIGNTKSAENTLKLVNELVKVMVCLGEEEDEMNIDLVEDDLTGCRFVDILD